MLEEMEVETIELIDEENELREFEVIERFKLDDNEYVVLAPFEIEEDEEDVAFVFKVVYADGEELYEDIDDDEEWIKIQNFVEENVDLSIEE